MWSTCYEPPILTTVGSYTTHTQGVIGNNVEGWGDRTYV